MNKSSGALKNCSLLGQNPSSNSSKQKDATQLVNPKEEESVLIHDGGIPALRTCFVKKPDSTHLKRTANSLMSKKNKHFALCLLNACRILKKQPQLTGITVLSVNRIRKISLQFGSLLCTLVRNTVPILANYRPCES